MCVLSPVQPQTVGVRKVPSSLAFSVLNSKVLGWVDGWVGKCVQ